MPSRTPHVIALALFTLAPACRTAPREPAVTLHGDTTAGTPVCAGRPTLIVRNETAAPVDVIITERGRLPTVLATAQPGRSEFTVPDMRTQFHLKKLNSQNSTIGGNTPVAMQGSATGEIICKS